MYTGIVQAVCPLAFVDREPNLMRFGFTLPPAIAGEVTLGASIAVNGCCFTVTDMNQDREGLAVTFDAIDETQELTNVKNFKPGILVNVERSAKQNAEVGGHVLSGHVVGTASVSDIERDENRCRMTFSAPSPWLKYVFEKGYVAVNGASLTVAGLDREKSTFAINLIPETLERTNFSLLKIQDLVNIEVESQTQVIVDTVERVMAERLLEKD